MNGINYLADTNCFIYLLNQNPTILSFAESGWGYSYITEMELLSKKGLTAKQDSIIRQMLDTCTKFRHDDVISELTIKLRRKYSLKLPDAIIAASAQSLNIPLLTGDKGFAQVKEIDCLIFEV